MTRWRTACSLSPSWSSRRRARGRVRVQVHVPPCRAAPPPRVLLLLLLLIPGRSLGAGDAPDEVTSDESVDDEGVDGTDHGPEPCQGEALLQSFNGPPAGRQSELRLSVVEGVR